MQLQCEEVWGANLAEVEGVRRSLQAYALERDYAL